jgi:hypothetical protein
MEPGPTPRREVTPLRHLAAARLRVRAVRGALIKIALGTVFLVGALAHALAPQRHERSSILWMTGLVLLSTYNIGAGLHILSRVRRRRGRLWLLAAGAWAILAVVLLGLLLRR